MENGKYILNKQDISNAESEIPCTYFFDFHDKDNPIQYKGYSNNTYYKRLYKCDNEGNFKDWESITKEEYLRAFSCKD